MKQNTVSADQIFILKPKHTVEKVARTGIMATSHRRFVKFIWREKQSSS